MRRIISRVEVHIARAREEVQAPAAQAAVGSCGVNPGFGQHRQKVKAEKRRVARLRKRAPEKAGELVKFEADSATRSKCPRSPAGARSIGWLALTSSGCPWRGGGKAPRAQRR